MTVLLEVLLISGILAFVLVVITRVLVDPKKLKDAKQEMAFYKDKVNKAQKEGNQEEVKRYTSMMMAASKKQFNFSMKPMMASMVVVLVALWFLGSTYHGVDPKITDSEGTFAYRGESFPVKLEDSSYLIDLDGNGFDESDKKPLDQIIEVGGSKFGFEKNSKTFLLLIAETPFQIPFIGKYFTWFWMYLFVSVPITFIFRKILGVD